MSRWNFVKMKKGEEIEGVYLAQYRNVGAFKKTVHEIVRIGQREKVHLWGSVVLNTGLYGVGFGSLIKISYHGKGKTPESNYPVHKYDVVVLEPADDKLKKKKKK